MTNIKSTSQGFTLIEMTVAIVLLSMMLLLLFSSIYTANKYWQISDHNIQKIDAKRLVNQFVRQYLSQAVPILWVTKGQKKLLFRGQRKQLQFVSNLPEHRGGGLYQLTLKTIQTDTETQLGISYQRLDPNHAPLDNNITHAQEFTALTNNIESIDLAYFGKQDKSSIVHWHDTWDNDEQLPQLVRLKINTQDQQDIWPTIIIPIRVVYLPGQAQFIFQATPQS